jgi:hypothetical protein
MRKQIQAKLVQITETLIESTGTVEAYVKENKTAELTELLTDMQQAALTIGNVLEQTEGKEIPIIHKLETLCEAFYELSTGQKPEALLHNIRKLLEELLHTIQQDIPVRKEVVFLPYQASMWDSLESIWVAANQDPEVYARVIPVPYHTLDPDRSLGELHYEGEKFPESVPVTDYREYDIEVQCPDIIFIHNPYDGTNSVTRIPEKYYAINLRKYTDMLVYVPYMVSDPGGPGPHQGSTPGVLCADRVIVQPGDIYERYCSLYEETLKQNHLEGKLPGAKEKFLPLGSPKFDALLGNQYPPERLPKAWRQVIQKSNGERKKIVFYNLTIQEVLDSSDYVVQKITDVMEFFRERADEAALIWRPHPLLLDSLGSLRADLLPEYTNLVEQFRKENWGIYDEGTDPNMGMAVCDLYYGGWSSMLTTYRATGKPFLVQHIRENESGILQEMLAHLQPSDAKEKEPYEPCGRKIYERVKV